MSLTIENVNLHGVSICCDNAETLVLAVTTAETLTEGLILARNSSTGNGGLYARGGANGLDNARFVLLSDTVVSDDDVVAGTKNVRVMEAGTVRQDKLSTYADDTINYLETDGLKDNNISVKNTTDYSVQDNQ